MLMPVAKPQIEPGSPFQVTIMHGTTRFSLTVDKSVTVEDIKSQIEGMTQVPAGVQKLIYQGRSLVDMTQRVGDLNIKAGDKIMVLGKRTDPKEGEEYRELVKVEGHITTTQKKLDDIKSEVDGIQKGFLPQGLQKSALPQLEVRVQGVAEELMRQLEKLDSVLLGAESSGTGGNSEAKTKRKKLVSRIQALLDNSDDLSKTVKELHESMVS